MMTGVTPPPRSRLARVVYVAPVCVALAGVGGCSSDAAASAPAPAVVTTSAPSGTPASPSGPSSSTSPATSQPGPPFIARVQWVKASGGRSLHIVPTASGRAAQAPSGDEEAWSEVVALAPDADQPGMRAQFDCHWTFARLVQADKPSWNIEPWRPVVSESQMVDARCNPGGPESEEN